MSKEKLKPCPFCGGEAGLSDTEGGDYVISCEKCDCQVFDDMKWGQANYDAKKNVIEKWNTRATSPLDELVEYCKFAIHSNEKTIPTISNSSITEDKLRFANIIFSDIIDKAKELQGK